MSVFYAFIERAFKILTELEMRKSYMDQAIYRKLSDAVFKMSEDGRDVFSKLIPRMGGFHIIIYMLKTIFSRFKDSEAIIRTNIIYLEKSGLFSIDENAFQNISTFRKTFQKKIFKIFANHYRPYQS